MRSFLQVTDAQTAAPYRTMTFPAYRGLLSFHPFDVSPLAISALQDDAPAGLALLAPSVSLGEAELLSIFVAPRFRRGGIALELMQRTLAHCKTRGINRVSASYMSGQDATEALETIFHKTGWEPPQTRMLVVRCSLDSIKAAPWLDRYALPEGYEVLPWVQVTIAERAALRASNEQKPWIAPDLVPFDYEQDCEPVTSVALRINGAIVGWCLNHIVDRTLRFTCSFVRRDLQRLGRIVLLYSDSVSRAPATGLSVGMWTVPVIHKGMANFARKHMQPYSIFFGETRGVTIRLGTAGETAD